MAYKELKSLYYGDNEAYAQEYLNRFNSQDAVKIDFTIGKNQAFFLQNTDVMSLAMQIFKLDKTIEKLCDSLPHIALEQYSKKCLIDEIVLTNKIEGVHSSRKEIGEALDILETQATEKKGTRSRFLGVVNKYLKLIDLEKIALNDSKDIRDIYDEVLLEEVIHENPSNKPDGELFRKNAVSVYSETGKEIHRGLTPESEIIKAMDKALAFLNDESIEELFRICIFHYFAEYIHPFYDGNGRLGRFLFSYGISNNLNFLIAFRISETIKENIKTYYKAFTACNDPRNLGDVTPFLMMQLSMILSAMEELKKSLEERKATWKKYEVAMAKVYGNDSNLGNLYSFLIQAALFSENGISMSELEKNMESSPYLIKKLMEKIPSNMMEIKKKGNTKYYNISIDTLNEKILQESVAAINKGE